VDEPCSPTPPTGQHQHQKRTFDVLQKPDIITGSRHVHAGDPPVLIVGFWDAAVWVGSGGGD
jgi:hypothetical protein